uniref:Uncharacterized protein n=1 Tax=Knipowitschia caucasica TaxID=637954 RepID=A0AAV2JU61_KNICA
MYDGIVGGGEVGGWGGYFGGCEVGWVVGGWGMGGLLEKGERGGGGEGWVGVGGFGGGGVGCGWGCLGLGVDGGGGGGDMVGGLGGVCVGGGWGGIGGGFWGGFVGGGGGVVEFCGVIEELGLSKWGWFGGGGGGGGGGDCRVGLGWMGGWGDGGVQTPLLQHPDSFFLQHDPTCAPSTCARHSAPYRHHQHQRRRPHRSASFHSSRLQSSQTSLPSAYDYLPPTLDWSDPELTSKVTVTQDWNRCGSLFSLPNISRCSARNYPKTPSVDQAPPFRLNVDALVGAEETDVDTGDKVSMDLSVVSAYIQASLSLKSRPVSAPPEEIVPSRSPSISDVSGVYKPATMGGRTGVSRSNSLGVSNGRCGSLELLETSTSPSSLSINHSDSYSIDDDKVEEEEEEEFYI